MIKLPAKIVILALVMIFAGGYIGYFFNGYLGLSDGNDYAGLARSLVRGEGFSLGHIYPLALTFDQRIPQPDNLWAPAYPVYLAVWFLILGVSDFSILFATIFAVCLLIFAVYLLGAKIGGPFWGLFAAAMTGLNQSVLGVALEGSPEILTAALLALAIITALNEERTWKIALSGVVFGLCVLARYQMILLAIPFFLLFLVRKRQLLIWWSLALFATISPWLIRNLIQFGNPIFSLQAYGEFTKGMGHLKYYYYNYRSFDPMTFWYGLTHFPYFMFKKFGAGLYFFTFNSPTVINFFGLIPFGYGIMKSWKDSTTTGRFAQFSGVSAVLVIIISSLDGHHWRHIVNLFPLLAVTIAIGLSKILDNVGLFRKRLAAVILVFMMFFPARLPFLELELKNNQMSIAQAKPIYEKIKTESNAGDIIISDASDAVWWYCDRSSIWLPVQYDDLVKLFDMIDSGYIYLEDSSEFFSTLMDEELLDFHQRTMLIDGKLGGWSLYRIDIDNGEEDEGKNIGEIVINSQDGLYR